jgi:hypothetical protein
MHRPGRQHQRLQNEPLRERAAPHGWSRVPREPFHNVPDRKTILISAERLKKWHKELERVDDMRLLVKELSISRRDESMLLNCSKRMKESLREVKEEIAQKLRG